MTVAVTSRTHARGPLLRPRPRPEVGGARHLPPRGGAGPPRRFPPALGARRGSCGVPPPSPFACKCRAIAGRFLPRCYANAAIGARSSPPSRLSSGIVAFLFFK